MECMRRASVYGVLLLAVAEALGDAAPAPVAPYLNVEDDAFLNRQADALLAQVEQTFTSMPPQLPEPRERRLALLLLDAVLHEPFAPNRPAVQQFLHHRLERAVESLEATRVTEGVQIWKLYNHGFVVRTATVTVAFDINPGPPAFAVYDDTGKKVRIPSPDLPIGGAVLSRLVDQCDALFISHRHGDHAVAHVAQMFVDQNKPVVAPDDVFKDTPLEKSMIHLERDGVTRHSLALPGREQEIGVVVFPGQQYQDGGIPNNVVLVHTPEGIAVMHNGDQINDPYPEYQEDFKWSDRIHENHDVDVLMTNCWMNDILRFVEGVGPRLVLPGHENELGHVLWDRVPYWGDADFLKLNYAELLASEYPVLVMTWGESYHYRSPANTTAGANVRTPH